jgi:hypothetical protein
VGALIAAQAVRAPNLPALLPPRCSGRMPASARLRRSDLAVYKAVIDALDQVLEDGVPRSAVVGADLALLAEWGHTWTRADAGLAGLRARWPPVDAADPALVALLVVARAVVRLAHDAGLTAAIAAGHHPAIVDAGSVA